MPDEFDSGFELLPQAEGVDVDEDLAAALAAEEGSDLEAAPLSMGRGWAFDFEAGQFVRMGRAPAEVYGAANLRTWIEKALRTARGAHEIYSDQFGIDMPPLIGQPFSTMLAADYAAAIEAALLVHDRIEQVREIKFATSANEDVLWVSFTVVTDDEELDFEDVPIGDVA